MPTFTYPGVYVEELSSGVHSITGVATSIAAFIGWAPQGTTTQAVKTESWAQYQTTFGGLDARSLLGYSVNQFFANGGTQAYIVRVAWDGSAAAAPGTSPAVATTASISGAGYATATITAKFGTVVSNSAAISVGAPVLQGLAVTPAVLPPVPVGATVQFAAAGVNSDGSSVAATATWTSSDPSILSFGVGGLATANGAGTVTVTAQSGFVTQSMAVAVVGAPLSTFTITQLTPAPAIGQMEQLAATFTYADGTSMDVTGLVAWASDNAPVATVGAATGVVTGVSAGTANITATLHGLTTVPAVAAPTLAVTVGAIVPVAVSIYPGTAVVKPTKVATFTAIATMSDGSMQEVTGGTWSCNSAAIATIAANGVDANQEDATAVALGSATISFVSGAFSASATLKVSAATLQSIVVTPVNATVAVNTTSPPVTALLLQLKATGIYNDGSTADLTQAVGWTSATPADATVDPHTGRVRGLSMAPAVTVNGSWQGVAASTTVAVTAAVLLSIAVTPASTTVGSGSSTPLTAMGMYSDGSTKNLTSTATWSSSAPAVATVGSGATAGIVKAVAAGGSLTLFAANPGAWGNSVSVTIQASPSDATRFGLLVQQKNAKTGTMQTVESFVNLSTVVTDANYVVTVIDSDSNYITFVPPGGAAPIAPTAVPAPTATAVVLGGGSDGAVLTPATDQNFELALTSNATSGYQLLDRVDIFNLLCIPGETDAETISTLQAYCAVKRAFFIVDAPKVLATVASLQANGPIGSTPGSLTSGPNAANSAYYFPWVEAPDPLFGNRPALYPPCGFVAGIYAATDASRGVWKAPAGIQAGITGASGLQYNLTDLENGDLNIQAINCLREFKVYGDVVWGARTLQGNDQAGSEWKYIPIRRLALYIESSLYDGTQWVVFEPNDEPLWGQIRLNVGSFLQGLFQQGAFQGTSPSQAYFVKCDAENNPQSSIDLGIVNVLVGFAPLYPAEFVVIQIQQIAGQLS